MYGLDVRPHHIKNYLTYSLKRLGVDYIDLYMPARIDLAIPVEETIGAISDMVKAGYVKQISKDKLDHSNSHIPLFSQDNINKNLSLVESLREIAAEKQITLPQLAVG